MFTKIVNVNVHADIIKIDIKLSWKPSKPLLNIANIRVHTKFTFIHGVNQ